MLVGDPRVVPDRVPYGQCSSHGVSGPLEERYSVVRDQFERTPSVRLRSSIDDGVVTGGRRERGLVP